MNPAVIVFAVDVEFTAPIIRLNRKSFFICKIFIIVNNNLYVAARNTFFEQCLNQKVECAARIVNVVNKKDFISRTKILRRISPTINTNTIVLFNVGIRACNNRRIQNRFFAFEGEFKIFTYNVRHISSATKRSINNVWNKTVLQNFMTKFYGIISNFIVRQKFLNHTNLCKTLPKNGIKIYLYHFIGKK